MRQLLAVLLLMGFIQSLAQAQNSISARIISGVPATENYDFFVTLLAKYEWAPGQYHWNPFCGGALLADGIVITAAHCVDGLASYEEIAIAIGDYSASMKNEYCFDDGLSPQYNCITEPEAGYHATGWTVFAGLNSELQIVRGRDFRIHPLYSSYMGAPNNDIALLELSSVVSNLPLSLPDSDIFSALASSSAQDSVTVIGHGDTLSDADPETFESSPQLLEAGLTPATDAVCISAFGRAFNTATMICAGDVVQDSCQGDSGGPLFEKSTGTLLGIVSWGPTQCAMPGSSYGVYTDVYQYREWIESKGSGFIRVSDGETLRMGNNAGSIGLPLVLLSLLLIRRRA